MIIIEMTTINLFSIETNIGNIGRRPLTSPNMSGFIDDKVAVFSLPFSRFSQSDAY